MPEEITRRQFLRSSAIVAGAAVVLDPSWLFGGVAMDSGDSSQGAWRARNPHRGSEGVFAQVEYGDGDTSPCVRWSRLGEDHTLELWARSIEVKVPSRSEAVMEVSLMEFDQGRGHHEVGHFFGAPTLAQLRTEVAYRAVFQ